MTISTKNRRFLIGGLAVGVPTLVVLAALAAVMHFPWLLFDEWTCARGEAPARQADGGSACFDLDGQLPAGYTWDPLGNRPFDCTNRPGWRTVSSGQDLYCLAEDRPLPPGFTPAP